MNISEQKKAGMFSKLFGIQFIYSELVEEKHRPNMTRGMKVYVFSRLNRTIADCGETENDEIQIISHDFIQNIMTKIVFYLFNYDTSYHKIKVNNYANI
jgi:hypothetical protein